MTTESRDSGREGRDHRFIALMFAAVLIVGALLDISYQGRAHLVTVQRHSCRLDALQQIADVDNLRGDVANLNSDIENLNGDIGQLTAAAHANLTAGGATAVHETQVLHRLRAKEGEADALSVSLKQKNITLKRSSIDRKLADIHIADHQIDPAYADRLSNRQDRRLVERHGLPCARRYPSPPVVKIAG